MGYTDQDLFLRWWGDAWTTGNWAASWSKAVEGLTPEQAAWRPPNAPGVPDTAGVRRSIWQIVEHMIFWRENMLQRADGKTAPSKEDMATKNFPEIRDRSPDAWADTLRRFEDSHRRLGEAVRTRYEQAAPAMWLLPHDSYHIGQVCYIRAMLGLAPIE